MQPLVSILIINYNNEGLLKRSIDSCFNQTYKKIEIVVFDDKSTDGSINELKKIDNIKLIINTNKKKNIPALDALNAYKTSFKNSTGQIIFLLDSDDYFEIDKVEKVVNFFTTNTDKIFLQNLTYLVTSSEKIEIRNKNSYLSKWPYFAPESCISFKREFFNELINEGNLFDNEYETVWLGFRLACNAFFLKKNFDTFNEHLTNWTSLGESRKYRHFNTNWWKRRYYSHKYLKNILKSKKKIYFNIDFVITFFIFKIFIKK